MEYLEHYRDEARQDKARQDAKDERRQILEQWLNTELHRFVNAMDMTDDAYLSIRDAVFEAAIDERVI